MIMLAMVSFNEETEGIEMKIFRKRPKIRRRKKTNPMQT